MNWLKRKINNWLNSDDEYIEPPHHVRNGARGSARGLTSSKVSADHGSDGAEFKNPMNITLYNAMGGRIVKFHRWNKQSDEQYECTYIIPSDEPFEESLGKYIAMEALKHVE